MLKTSSLIKYVPTDLPSLVESIELDFSNMIHLSPRWRQFGAERLVERMKKKFISTAREPHEKAVEAFLRANSAIPYKGIYLPDEIIGEARDFIYRMLERHFARRTGISGLDFDLGTVLRNWRHGPGAGHGVVGSGFVMKLGQPMTCTKRARPYVELIRQLTPHLREYDLTNVDGIAEDDVLGSVFGTVHKNDEIAREIATEPTGNMACQLALGQCISDALRGIGVHIEGVSCDSEHGSFTTYEHGYDVITTILPLTQAEMNKIHARIGSEADDRCTLDLKSASHFMLYKLIMLLWPDALVRYADAVRSPMIKMPDGEWIKNNVFATMGCGFTFPMMTATLLALCYAVERCYFGSKERLVHFASYGVFGDDIICPTGRENHLARTLHQAGFVVNKTKSFTVGPFRESCGGDYYEGHDVTPFYIKTLATVPDLYSAINMVLTWSAKMQIPMDHTVAHLVRLLRLSSKKHGIVFVPEWEDPSSGILTSLVDRVYWKYEFRPAKYYIDDGCPETCRRLKNLRKKRKVRTIKMEPTMHLLATVAGYLKGDSAVGLSVTSLRGEGRWRRTKCVLPEMYTDGSCPSRSMKDRAWIDRIVFQIRDFELPRLFTTE